MTRPLAYALSSILLLFVLACGSPATTVSTAVPGGSGATAAPAQAAKVGDRVEQGGVALTVIKAERKAELGQFLKAGEGKEYIICEVLVENAGDAKAPYNLLYFKLKDDSGFEYNATIGADQALGSGELAKGEKARGNVPFEVKKDAKGLVLQYKPVVLGSSIDIKVALP